MGLLKAITSPMASVSKPSKKTEKSFSSFSASSYPPYSEFKKEHKKPSNRGECELSLEDSMHKNKKMKPLFVNTEPLTLKEPDGLKMKLILSPKEKSTEEVFTYPATSSVKKSSKKTSKDEHNNFQLSPEIQGLAKLSHKKPKSEAQVNESFDSEASLYSEAQGSSLSEYDFSGLETHEPSSSSVGEMKAGELVVDDSYREIKKKKKSKKSKKKKDKEKEKHKEKKHSKSKKTLPLSPGEIVSPSHTLSPTAGSPTSVPFHTAPVFHSDIQSEKKKKKKKEDKEKEKLEKPKKKKNMSAYQLFCKEYRVNIVAEHPGIDFGELSKKLAEVWKQLLEKDKLAWKQKAQYLQHKQNKAEATTVKRKLGNNDSSSKSKELQLHLSASSSSASSPHKKSPSSTSISASPVKVPEVDPIDVAAHLQLLGESLSLIGHRLQETEGMVAVSGSLSVLLDSILCALGPLSCLTAQVPELNGCPKQVLSNTLDNIAYIMPGL
ncbi:HMG domain-containing protein 4-like isoform X1 [Protopterus annectens]|uniref:HMG domain-containing protein 4-like isoform X1 n=1 Tax=Protopterus annectens TaxID=7888 RepID=UPI001CFC360F|nr:HMG domain-containing protein 4-like isoform X1 [Protopterus annectens]